MARKKTTPRNGAASQQVLWQIGARKILTKCDLGHTMHTVGSCQNMQQKVGFFAEEKILQKKHAESCHF
jgi:hypothetical protein